MAAARADLLRRLGRRAEASAAYVRALELATNDAERRFLEACLREADAAGGNRPGGRKKLAGYYLVEAKDLDEAIRLAARIPNARDGSIEVRPVRMMPKPQ